MKYHLLTYLLLFSIVLLATQSVHGQFNILESFRTSEVNDLIILGGEDSNSIGAVLTAAEGIDPPNEGWLRLTTADNNQRGFAFINKSFPSTLGVQVEMEYKMYRSGSANGADGFTVFLFDGEIDEHDFRIGGYGGSLGYNVGNGEGLKGGYLGIGFDVYGNYSQENGLLKNHVVIRGSAKTNYQQIAKAKAPEAMDIGERNSRPSDEDFYRKVQVKVEPTDDNKYHVWVGWKTAKTEGPYTELLTATIDEKPFETLKVGFAASTGGSVNYHEIRDVIATTPGNLRVAGAALQEEIVFNGDNADGRNEFEFAIKVFNETEADLRQITLNHSFKDIQGLLEKGRFEITDLTWSGFLEASLPSLDTIRSEPSFTGTVSLAGGSDGEIIISGKLLRPLRGDRLFSEASVETDEIEDIDLENNRSTVSSLVDVEGVDLAIHFKEPNYCLDGTNAIDLVIENLGNTRADYTYNNNNSHDPGEIMLQFKVIPQIDLTIEATSDWKEISRENGIYKYVLAQEIGGKNNLHIPPGSELAPFTFTFNGESLDEVTIEAEVVYEHPGWHIKEADLINNVESIIITRQIPPLLDLPGGDQELIYCVGETAAPIKAIPNSDNDIIWYNEAGDKLPGPPTPDTGTPGRTMYYVTQTNGYCESPATEVQVVVLGPEPGEIEGPEDLCLGNAPFILGTTVTPEVDGTLITYHWQQSLDGMIWTDIDGADQSDYQADRGLNEPTYFRRWVVATYNGRECRSQKPMQVYVEPQTCMIMVNPALPSYSTP